ncbi:MAG: hypothetical protein J6P79_02485 [Pseudobutyrivibrio sp.]|nr:hypothetical protein [Pseudobutyrivibrio sp.]
MFCLEVYDKRNIEIFSHAAIISGGTYSTTIPGYGSTTVVKDGVIKDYTILYEAGVTDDEINQWYAEAGQTNENSSSTTAETTTTPANNSTDEVQSNDNDSNEQNITSPQVDTKRQYTDEEIEAAWGETNRVESTCTEAGYIEYTNSLTKETKTEELELAKHQYEETERTEPTCTEEGSVTYTCSVCGNTYDETLPATGHSYEWATTKEAGLFTDGLEEEVCSICGEKSGATHTLSAKIANPVVLLIICGIIIVTVGASSFILLHKRQAKNVLQSKKS